MHTCIGVGSEASALLVAGVDDLKLAVLKLFVEAQNVITRYAEDVTDAVT
jgi:hypothetical protein